MDVRKRRRSWLALLLAVFTMSLFVAACGDDEEGGGGGGGGNGGVETDVGVTSEPCPNGNPDRGCIYLGLITDETGAFKDLAIPVTEGQKDFWARVNRQGGIGGEYDVNVTKFIRDNAYDPQTHVQRYREIEGEVLALGQSLGTPMTVAALDFMDDDDMVANAGTWWSGWTTDDEGVVLESGTNYCVQAMNGLDFIVDEFQQPETILAVGYPGDYGGDGAAGATIWAEINGGEVSTVETAPNAVAGNQDGVVGAIRRQNPDVVYVSTGPAEMAEIVAGAVAGGYEGHFVGAVPSYAGAVLDTPAGEAIQTAFHVSMPHAPIGGESAAHDAMRKALGGELPPNDGYTFGWVWSYPLKAVLDSAFESGDMTREGLRAAVEGTTVDSEGALPPRELGGEPNDQIVRTGVIAQPDPQADLGVRVVRDTDTEYPTAQEYEVDGACASAG